MPILRPVERSHVRTLCTGVPPSKSTRSAGKSLYSKYPLEKDSAPRTPVSKAFTPQCGHGQPIHGSRQRPRTAFPPFSASGPSQNRFLRVPRRHATAPTHQDIGTFHVEQASKRLNPPRRLRTQAPTDHVCVCGGYLGPLFGGGTPPAAPKNGSWGVHVRELPPMRSKYGQFRPDVTRS